MKILAKVSAVIISAAMALTAFGCGSSDSATQTTEPGFEPQDIEINDPGYSISDDGKLRYAFVAVNPNDGYIAEDVIFTIEAYDANGSMIAGGGETISALYPGTETASAGEADMYSQTSDTPEVASLSIVAMMDSVTWTKTTLAGGDVENSMDIVSPRMSNEDNGDLEIKATLGFVDGDDMKLDASKPIELRVVALLFDESGQAICGTAPLTFTLNSADATYEYVATIADPPKYAECTLYVTPN